MNHRLTSLPIELNPPFICADMFTFFFSKHAYASKPSLRAFLIRYGKKEVLANAKKIEAKYGTKNDYNVVVR